ncbi:MAG: STAS domain-containing protein [bacterium]
MSDQFEIEIGAEKGSALVLKLKGRLTAGGAHELRELCSEQRERGHQFIVIDLAEVSFVASSGLGTFLLLTEEFSHAGGKVVFAMPCESVVRVIKLLNLDKFLEIVDSVAKALNVVEV